MHIIGFTIKQADLVVGNSPIREQAVSAAKTRAQQTGIPVSVIAHLDTGADREVIFYPDGTNERIWAIDQGRRIQPVVGAVYTNRGGGRFAISSFETSILSMFSLRFILCSEFLFIKFSSPIAFLTL